MKMFTYQMKIRNKDDWKKIVYVTASDFHNAVKVVKADHGKDWTVYESSIISAK